MKGREAALSLHVEKRRAYIKKQLKRYRPAGAEMVLCGCLMLGLWAMGDLITRWDAMDGLLKVYFGLVKDGTLSLQSALSRLWQEGEARRDLISLAYLALVLLLSLIGIISHKSRKGYFTLALGIGALCYDPHASFLSRALNYTLLVKYCGCALTLAGSLLKTGLTLAKTSRLRLKYDKKHPLPRAEERKPLSAVGKEKTLIPKHKRRIER